jgi:putative aldouronate transport system permease protein
LFLPVLYVFLFHYMPMYGIQIAFKNFMAARGIWGSPWVGLKHFRDFFGAYYWKRLVINTVLLNVYSLLFSFPVPVLLALMLNQVESGRFRAFVQTVLYAPHFISLVVLVGMLYIFFSPVSGIVNRLIETLGGKAVYFMNEPRWFRALFIGSGIWQNAGWGTIIYLAALSGIDPQLYEAATIDGASKWHKIWYVDIPGILPIVVTLLIMNTGSILSSGFEKPLLMNTPGNITVSNTIGLYVYQRGLLGAQFSFTTAIGLMLNVINFGILFAVNKIAQNTGEGQSSIW